MTKHTPPPWKLNVDGSGDVFVSQIETAKFICDFGAPDEDGGREDAEYTVRCVNSHEQMLDALRVARDALLKLGHTIVSGEVRQISDAILEGDGTAPRCPDCGSSAGLVLGVVVRWSDMPNVVESSPPKCKRCGWVERPDSPAALGFQDAMTELTE